MNEEYTLDYWRGILNGLQLSVIFLQDEIRINRCQSKIFSGMMNALESEILRTNNKIIELEAVQNAVSNT